MTEDPNAFAVALFSEILAADQLLRNRLTRVLSKGMEISHFSVLNHLAFLAPELGRRASEDGRDQPGGPASPDPGHFIDHAHDQPGGGRAWR